MKIMKIATISDFDKPIKTDVSAEQMVTNRYMDLFSEIKERAEGASTGEERKVSYEEIKGVLKELKTVEEKITDHKDKEEVKRLRLQFKKLIKRYFRAEAAKDKEQEPETPETPEAPLPPPSPDQGGQPIIPPPPNAPAMASSNIEQKVAEEYARKICTAINNKHKDTCYAISYPHITVFDSENKPLLIASVDDELNVNSIVPCHKLSSMYPLHSVGFYQKYFKPIVEALGHFSIGKKILSVKEDLPDSLHKEGSCSVDAWDMEKKAPTKIAIAFKGEKPIWFFEEAQAVSQYTKEDYLNAIVKCTDDNLKSIFGRTGTVIEVMPRSDFIEVDVDFGRGIGIVRLTEQQIEILPLN